MALEHYDPAYESVLEAEADRLLAAAGIVLEKQVEIFDGAEAVARKSNVARMPSLVRCWVTASQTKKVYHSGW